jgi:hypothetical protein
VAVQRRTETLLVVMMTDETDAPAKNKQSIESTDLLRNELADKEEIARTDLDVLLCLFCTESATVTQQIHKTDGNASINVQDKLQNGGLNEMK